MLLRILQRSLANSATKTKVQHLTVLIQVPEAPGNVLEPGPRLVLEEYFYSPRSGKNKTYFTKSYGLERAALAAMQMLKSDITTTDFEIVSVETGQHVLKHCVVWFPKQTDFDPRAVLYEPGIRHLSKKMTNLHEAIRLAELKRNQVVPADCAS